MADKLADMFKKDRKDFVEFECDVANVEKNIFPKNSLFFSSHTSQISGNGTTLRWESAILSLDKIFIANPLLK